MKDTPQVLPPFSRATFTGVPTRFRGWCYTASEGGRSGGYRWVGLQFGNELLSLEPYDLEPDEWHTVVHWMVTECIDPGVEDDASGTAAPVDYEALDVWLHRHFPRIMKLVPKRRRRQFIDGIVEAYEGGEMLADLPCDFEPVELDLDDPCGGVGYIPVGFDRPTPRYVVYQCPAPSCREASRVAVETYARENDLPIVEVGDVIAAVMDMSSAEIDRDQHLNSAS